MTLHPKAFSSTNNSHQWRTLMEYHEFSFWFVMNRRAASREKILVNQWVRLWWGWERLVDTHKNLILKIEKVEELTNTIYSQWVRVDIDEDEKIWLILEISYAHKNLILKIERVEELTNTIYAVPWYIQWTDNYHLFSWKFSSPNHMCADQASHLQLKL